MLSCIEHEKSLITLRPRPGCERLFNHSVVNNLVAQQPVTMHI